MMDYDAISREEMARLGATRPFWKFVNFPIVLSGILQKGGVPNKNGDIYAPLCNCEKPERKNPSGACGCNWCIKCDSKISCVAMPIEWETADFSPGSIGVKPMPIKIVLKEKQKETYISPFSGRVV
jgi:hypothetical protein